MSIQVGPANTSAAWNTQSSASKASTANTAPAANTGTSADPVDVYEKSTPENTAAASGYGKKAVNENRAVLKQMWKDLDAKTNELRNLISRMFGVDSENKGQGYWAVAADAEKWAAALSTDFEVDEATQAEAQALIAEDGYFGVKQTTDRLINFAKALGGENASAETIEGLREATVQGFKDVAKLFGSKDGDISSLPEVSQKTYEAVMKEFDNWAASVTE